MSAIALLVLLAAAPDPGAAKLLPRIDGWKLLSPPATYTADNLYEYNDGGAEAFLQFDFLDLTSATYVNTKKVEVTAELYHQRDATRAFGIYSQERRPGSTKMPGKLEGVASKDHLEFVAGAYYVKLALPSGGDPAILPKFAERIAAKLPGPRTLPSVLACFPDQGKRPRAEKLTARDFLGHKFLHDAATAPYAIDGARFRLFAVEGKDNADARNMVEGFRSVAKLPKADVGGEGTLTLKDPLNGEVLLAWRGRWLWGAVDDPSPRRKALVEELGRRLGSAACAPPR
jgi:hypothetical protein